MRNLFLATSLAIAPMTAFSDDITDCPADWAEITEVVGAIGSVVPDTSVTASADGWCEIATGNLAALGSSLDGAKFRLDQFPQSLAGARSIEIELSGMQTPVGSFDGNFALSLQIESGAVRLHQLRLFAPDGRGLRATADVSVAALTGLGTAPDAQSGVVNIDLMVTPNFLTATQINFAEVTRSAVDRALRDVRDAQVSGKSRREFLRFLGAAPNARGTLNIAGEGTGDVTIFQIVRPFLSLSRDPLDAEITSAFDAALEGVSLDLTWKPGRM